jgi:hypothetical protein
LVNGLEIAWTLQLHQIPIAAEGVGKIAEVEAKIADAANHPKDVVAGPRSADAGHPKDVAGTLTAVAEDVGNLAT